jgi:hypothetical protein
MVCAQVDTRALNALAGSQHGVVTRRQLVALGMTARQIGWRLQEGELRSLHRGVYGIDLHRTTALARHERRERNGVPVTAPVRTLIDFAASAGAEECEQAVAEAFARPPCQPWTDPA